MKTHKTDILILGSGGAGLFAALHAHQANPNLSITVAVKGLLGKCGCTRMVQGGYNVAVAGVLMIDVRTGEFVMVRAQAVLLATGGGPTMYKYHTPSGDKTCDGMAMALRAGLTLRDMEMVQFHPTGLIAGPHTRITGTIIEEGLRGAGGYLLNGAKERFMPRYDPKGERATRDVVSRAMFAEIKKSASPHGGLYLSMGHLGPDKVRKEFKGMVE